MESTLTNPLAARQGTYLTIPEAAECQCVSLHTVSLREG